MSGHDWQKVTWSSGQHKGKIASQRLCCICEVWETKKNSGQPCRGKKWQDMTDQEKAQAFGTQPVDNPVNDLSECGCGMSVFTPIELHPETCTVRAQTPEASHG